MKDKNDNKTRDMLKSATAQRQADFRKRMKDAGFTQKVTYQHEESFKRGGRAYESGGLLTDFSDSDDAASFAAGFAAAAIEHEKTLRRSREKLSVAEMY